MVKYVCTYKDLFSIFLDAQTETSMGSDNRAGHTKIKDRQECENSLSVIKYYVNNNTINS